MRHRFKEFFLKYLVPAIFLLILTGCSTSATTPAPVFDTPETPQTATTATDSPEASPTPVPTEISLAARVNGIEITQQVFELELAMYQQASGTELSPEDRQVVLDDLINRALLASAAAEQGFIVDDAILQEHLAKISAEIAPGQSLSDWMSAYNCDEKTFEQALMLSIASAWMRDQIVQAVPETAEQVHARQILLYDAATAADVYQQLQAGNSFRNLALKYDPITAGDLGWFPKGYLFYQAVEEAVFKLEPDQYSAIVETPSGFHILQLLEKDPERVLSPDARRSLQEKALQDWLSQAREKSQIEVLVSA